MSQNFTTCQKCQNIFFPDFEEGTEQKMCPYCKLELTVLELTYDDYQSMPKSKRCKKCKRKYPKIFIKCPKCNQQLIKLSTENKKSEQQVQQIINDIQSKQQNVPKCPTCGSTNIKRISTLNRAASIGVFGILSGKIGKNYECLNCKAKW